VTTSGSSSMMRMGVGDLDILLSGCVVGGKIGNFLGVGESEFPI